MMANAAVESIQPGLVRVVAWGPCLYCGADVTFVDAIRDRDHGKALHWADHIARELRDGPFVCPSSTCQEHDRIAAKVGE